jgi:hypothetical protein
MRIQYRYLSAAETHLSGHLKSCLPRFPWGSIEANMYYAEILPSAQEAKLSDGKLKPNQKHAEKQNLFSTSRGKSKHMAGGLGLSRTRRKQKQEAGVRFGWKLSSFHCNV